MFAHRNQKDEENGRVTEIGVNSKKTTLVKVRNLQSDATFTSILIVGQEKEHRVRDRRSGMDMRKVEVLKETELPTYVLEKAIRIEGSVRTAQGQTKL